MSLWLGSLWQLGAWCLNTTFNDIIGSVRVEAQCQFMIRSGAYNIASSYRLQVDSVSLYLHDQFPFPFSPFCQVSAMLFTCWSCQLKQDNAANWITHTEAFVTDILILTQWKSSELGDGKASACQWDINVWLTSCSYTIWTWTLTKTKSDRSLGKLWSLLQQHFLLQKIFWSCSFTIFQCFNYLLWSRLWIWWRFWADQRRSAPNFKATKQRLTQATCCKENIAKEKESHQHRIYIDRQVNKPWKR